MTEARIFTLLAKLCEENTEIEINEYSKLIPEHVTLITKSLSNILYSTVKENNISSSNKRTNTINFIRKLCQRDQNHFNVTNNNYESILSSVFKDHNEVEMLESDEVIKETTIHRIRKFYELKDKKAEEMHMKYNQIFDWDKKLLNDEEFHMNRCLFNKNTFENSFLELTGNTLDNYLQKDMDLSSAESCRCDIVKVAYALLNMERTKENLKLLRRVLKEINSNPNKKTEEIKLIKYIWNNIEILNLKEECVTIITKFPFIYEDVAINVCKNLITSSAEAVNINSFETYDKNLIKYCRLYPCVKLKVLTVLYELYSLSNYHNNILLLITLFNKNT